MIITFEDDTLKTLVTNPSLKNNDEIIRSLNNILLASRDKEHLLLIDPLVIEYLIEKYNDVLDQSSLRELDFLRNSEIVDHDAFLTKLPYFINIIWNDSVPIDEVRAFANPKHPNGRMFNVNIFSFKSHIFLGSSFAVISENETDVNFYSMIAKMYMHEFYGNHAMTTFNSISGIGGNISAIINQSLSNNQKILMICDPDIRHPEGIPEEDSTYLKVYNAFHRNKRNKIINFISLKAHEKENLLPVSWFREHNRNFRPCPNVINLEDSSYRDRLLFIDLKKGLKKIELQEDLALLSYYRPVIDELGINLEVLQDEEKVFSVSACSNWDNLTPRILRSKRLDDFPDYLEENILTIGLNFVGWVIGGRSGIA